MRLHKCPQLVRLGEKLTGCRIYKKRLGYKHFGRRCILRADDKRRFEGCPLNS